MNVGLLYTYRPILKLECVNDIVLWLRNYEPSYSG